MDGASKFVSGDAIAGLLILLINVIGGLAIGVAQHNMSVADAGKLYVLLTIGDGLVAQIPSLLLSLSTAIIVTRVTTAESMTEQAKSQLSNPSALFIASGILVVSWLGPRHATHDFRCAGFSHCRLGFDGDTPRGASGGGGPSCPRRTQGPSTQGIGLG
jgi:flagellar biosynthesis component FlhA